MSAVSSSLVSISYFDFPPFFTLQPNDSLRSQQLQLWVSHVLDYIKLHSKTLINLSEDAKSSLFSNEKIKRSLNSEGIRSVCESLVKSGYGVWAIGSGNRLLHVSTRSLDDWANEFYRVADENGHVGAICTLYELVSGDLSHGASYKGLAEPIAYEALRILEKRGVATIIKGENLGETGVKFRAQTK
jgi:ESCRT-II complex subunit VPS25